MNKQTYWAIQFQKTDDAWSAELHAIFGKRAGDVRFTKEAEGAPNTVLRNLYEMRDIARQMWEREVFGH